MASVEGDFEKGAENGCRDSLRLVVAVARLWKDFTRWNSALLAKS
jgi:hypothetical protein